MQLIDLINKSIVNPKRLKLIYWRSLGLGSSCHFYLVEKAIKTIQVYYIGQDGKETITKYTAGLVVKEYSQIESIYFHVILE